MLLFTNCTAPHKPMVTQDAIQCACDHGFGKSPPFKGKPPMLHFLSKWLFRIGLLLLEVSYKINVPATWD